MWLVSKVKNIAWLEFMGKRQNSYPRGRWLVRMAEALSRLEKAMESVASRAGIAFAAAPSPCPAWNELEARFELYSRISPLDRLSEICRHSSVPPVSSVVAAVILPACEGQRRRIARRSMERFSLGNMLSVPLTPEGDSSRDLLQAGFAERLSERVSSRDAQFFVADCRFSGGQAKIRRQAWRTVRKFDIKAI
jgi:hypothetical protein